MAVAMPVATGEDCLRVRSQQAETVVTRRGVVEKLDCGWIGIYCVGQVIGGYGGINGNVIPYFERQIFQVRRDKLVGET